MKKTKLTLLLATAFLLSGLYVHAQQLTDRAVFPLNDYLYTNGVDPYPIVNDAKLQAIDRSNFVNVMDYGAKGDGKTYDDDAIKKAFTNAKYGVIFPAGKTFMVSKITKIKLNHDLTVYAYGATIRMAPQCRYSFLSLQYQSGSYHNKVIWLGGTLDGNQYNQIWPGNPHGGKYNGKFVESHGRFLGVSFAEFALFKDITLVNTVVDGPSAEACKLAVFANSTASGGAPISYSQVQEQGTYFKVTRQGMKTAYFLNLQCSGGSIATHCSYPTKASMDYETLSVHANCNVSNQAQDAIHIEDCYKNFFYNCTISSDDASEYKQRIHLSNRSGVVSLKGCHFTNAWVNFNQASNLKFGLVDGCTFNLQKGKLRTFVQGHPHISTNNSFQGSCSAQQADVQNIRNCTFTNFGSLAASAAYATDGSKFVNGSTPVTTRSGGFVVNCTFQQVNKTNYNSNPNSSSWQKVFSSYIDVYSDANKYLGRIDCGNQSSLTQKNADRVSDETTVNSLKSNLPLNNSAATVKLFPNPATDVVHVSLNEVITGKTYMTIYDLSGKLIQTRVVNKTGSVSSETFDVRNFTPGVYTLQVYNTNYSASYRFVVAR